MAGNKYISLNSNGDLAEVAALQTSAGAGSAGSIVALNASGLIDNTMLPTAEEVSYTASESISAGSFVNIWNNSGTIAIRNADAASGKPAHGYAPAAISISTVGNIIEGNGQNTSLTSLTLGTQYFLGNSGAVVSTPPSASGSIVQKVGVASATTTLDVRISPVYVVRA